MPSSQPIMNTIGYSRPFALWRVISVTRPSSSRRVSASATSAICWRKASSVSAPSSARASNSRDLDELLEVLDAPLRLDRPLGLERVDVARLAEDRLEEVADRHALLRPLAQAGHRLHEPSERPLRRGAQPRHGRRLGGGVP